MDRSQDPLLKGLRRPAFREVPAERQPVGELALGLLITAFATPSLRPRARFCRASSGCDFRLELAVASRAYSKSIIAVGELEPERGNVNDCAVDGVLRRHRIVGFGSLAEITTPSRSHVCPSSEDRAGPIVA